MCFGCSKEPSHRDGSFEYPQHRDGSFEYPQHMFWLRNKKSNFLLRTLIWGPDPFSLFTQNVYKELFGSLICFL